MATIRVGVLLSVLAVVAALPADHVISKSPGLRYQYMVGPEGPQLVDTWMTVGNLLEAARYNPDQHNNYHLFTRVNPTTSQPLPFGLTNVVSASNFDANKKTVVLVHGWNNTPNSDFNVHLIHAYLAAQDVNVIMVDWSVGAVQSNYMTALNNAITSGGHAARFILWLNSVTGASLSNYHIIGHSLGGHQCGIIGRQLGGIVPYITSLDPALPGWITNSQSFKSTDGIYTEVMHTNAGFSGLLSPVGDVDFYPNGGTHMSGCGSDLSCSHHRCIFYMAESLTSGGFTGTHCTSVTAATNGNCNSSNTLNMGGVDPKTGTTGIFHLNTNAGAPFSQG